MLRTVSAMHMHLDQPAPRLAQANLVLKGYEKKLADDRDPRAKPRKATAVSPAILAELTGRGLQGAQELTRLRDTAMLYLNYGAAMRASELVRVNIEDVTEEERGMVVAIYRVKTRQHADARIPAEDSPVTVAAIKKWIAVLAAHGRTSGPLFPVICKHGEWGNGHCGPHGEDRMTERSAGRRVRLAAQEAGLEGRFTIHSGRRGFATEAAHAGHGMLAIARHGRAWSDNSRSLQGYIDDAATWTMNPLKGAGA
jgi:integrase